MRLIAPIVALIALLIVTPTFAQSVLCQPGCTYIQAPDGSLWFVAEGTRTRIIPTLVTNESLAAIPEIPQDGWKTVAHFDGRNPTKTPPFTVGKRWRLVYDMPSTNHTIGSACIDVGDVSDKKNSEYIGCLTGAGVTYQYRAGTFYLDVSLVDVGYSVDVQELR